MFSNLKEISVENKKNILKASHLIVFSCCLILKQIVIIII